MRKPRTLDELLEKHRVKVRCPSGVGLGWIPLLDRTIRRMIAAGWRRRAGQIKEKFGGLQFYLDGNHSERIREMTYRAEEASTSICEACGKAGCIRNRHGCLMSRCASCWRSKK